MDYADVREGLYTALCTIPAVGSRVFRGWTAPADTPKPLIEFTFDGEIPSINKCTLHMGIEIVCYGDPDHALDILADDIVSLLDEQPFVTPLGNTPELQYTRDSHQDIYSDNLKSWGIRLKFWLPSQYWT
jgi:hypothetical protein